MFQLEELKQTMIYGAHDDNIWKAYLLSLQKQLVKISLCEPSKA